MQCQFIKPNKKQCGGHALTSDKFCFYHNPKVKDEDKHKARSKGGSNNKIVIGQPLSPMSFKKAHSVVELLEETINLVRAGDMEVKIANCIGFLSGHIIKAIEVSELTQKIHDIEREMNDIKNKQNGRRQSNN